MAGQPLEGTMKTYSCLAFLVANISLITCIITCSAPISSPYGASFLLGWTLTLWLDGLSLTRARNQSFRQHVFIQDTMLSEDISKAPEFKLNMTILALHLCAVSGQFLLMPIQQRQGNWVCVLSSYLFLVFCTTWPQEVDKLFE